MDKDTAMKKPGTETREPEFLRRGRSLSALLSLPLVMLVSCASTDTGKTITIPEELKETKAVKPPAPELKMPQFIPVAEDISSLKTKIVDISARNTPLRDVLHVISESTGINLVMEKGVNSETPITLTLKNINAEDALNTIISSVDYFYSIKDNMLVVKAIETRNSSSSDILLLYKITMLR